MLIISIFNTHDVNIVKIRIYRIYMQALFIVLDLCLLPSPSSPACLFAPGFHHSFIPLWKTSLNPVGVVRSARGMHLCTDRVTINKIIPVCSLYCFKIAA